MKNRLHSALLPGYHFFGVLTLGVLCLCFGLLSILLGPADTGAVLQLGNIRYNDWGYRYFPVQVTESQLGFLKAGLLAGFGFLSAALLFVFIRRKGFYRELHFLKAELKSASRQTLSLFTHLSLLERRLALVLLLLLTGFRLYFLFTYPTHVDEAASYDYFVSEGPLAVIAYYPIPNNHILFNLICAAVYAVTPAFELVMRLPTLLLSTAGTALLFLLALRLSNYTVALLSTSLFHFTATGLFFSFTGRGYYLYYFAALLVLYCTWQLCFSERHQRVYWLGWVLGSVAGFYTIPAFLYPFAAAGLLAGLYLLRRRAFPQLARLIKAGALVAAATLVLYLPVLVVSGAGAVAGNSYVAPLPLGPFLEQLPDFLFRTERNLNGLKTIGAFLLALVSSGVLAFRWRAKETLLHRLGLPALALIWLPYLFLTLQRVQPPERVLYFKTFFYFLLLGLLLDYGLRKRAVRPTLRALLAAGLCLVLGSYQALVFHRDAAEAHTYDRQMQASYRALQGQQPRTVLVQEPLYQVFYSYYARQQGQRLVLQSEPADQAGDVVVQSRNLQHRKPLPEAGNYRLFYANDFVQLYRLAP